MRPFTVLVLVLIGIFAYGSYRTRQTHLAKERRVAAVRDSIRRADSAAYAAIQENMNRRATAQIAAQQARANMAATQAAGAAVRR